MTRMTRPDCAVMCNLINTHTHTHTHTYTKRYIFIGAMWETGKPRAVGEKNVDSSNRVSVESSVDIDPG